MAQAGTVWVDVRGDTSGLVRDIGTAAQTAGRSVAGGLGAGARTVLSDLGTAAGVSAIGIGAIGGAAVKASIDFNKSMSGVSAVAGATAAELDLLREAALQAGADTAFSASEAAQAQGELVRAGVSVSDVLGGALAGALGLAAAGQLDLANAAEISAQALNIFDLAGSETTRVADVLAAGANKSAADVAQLGDALRQGGLVAAQTGLSLEDTVGVLALFADNALIGSDAGTSFKTFLQRLVPQSDAAAESMADLGLEFFDATGAFVGIESVAGQLQQALGGLSDEQRQAALTTLFGSDAVRAASVLMDGGAAAVRDYTAAVNDQGAAAEMAAEQLNNLAGDIEEFKGSVETSLIRIGDLFDGTNRAIAQGGTEIVNVFNDFAATPAWGAIQENIERLSVIGGGSLEDLAGRLSDALASIDASDVDEFFARVEGGFSTVKEAAEGLEPVIAGVGIAFSTMALGAIPFIGQLVPAISPLTGLLGGLVLGSQQGRDALAELGDRAASFATGPGVDLLDSIAGLADSLSAGLVSALEDVGGAIFDAGDALGPVFADAIDQLGPPVGDLLESLGELAGEVLPLLADVAGTVIPPAVDLLSGSLSVAADATGFLADNLELLIPAFAGFVALKYGDQIGAVGTALKGVGDQALYLRDSVGQIAATQGVSKLEALRGVAGSTSREMGSLVGSIGGLNLALVGVTAGITVGAAVYQTWANNIAEVRREGELLLEDLLAGADVQSRIAEQLNNAFDREGSRDDFEQTGLSIAAVSEIINQNAGDIDEFRQRWYDAGQSLIIFRRNNEEIPEGIRPIIDTLFDLADQGVLTGEELENIIDVLTDVDKNARDSADGFAYQGDQLEKLIPKAQLTSEVLRDLATASDTSAGLDAQRDALARLAERFPELAAAAGIALGDIEGDVEDLATTTADAVGELRALAGELEKLAGASRNVDEAQRDLNDSIQRVLESVSKNGKGVDITTEAGRRNADAIQQMVEAGERLAESQALTDKTGESSRQTLKGIADQLGGLYEANVITSDEYARLIGLYGLTPDQINTRVAVDISEAQVSIDAVQQKLGEMKDLSEADKVKIQAEIDAGNYEGVLNLLNALAADKEATIKAEADEQSLRVVTEKLNSLPGVTEPERSSILAQLDAGNVAGVDALLNDLARARNAIINVVISGAPADRKNILGNFGNALRPEALAAAAADTPKEIQTQVGIALREGRTTDAANLLNLWREDLADGNITNPLLVQFGLGGKRAKGGPVKPGVPYLVGEEGPELIVPELAASVVPNGETTQILGGNMAASDGAVVAELQGVRAGLDNLATALASARPIYISEAERGSRTAEDVIRMARRPLLGVG